MGWKNKRPRLIYTLPEEPSSSPSWHNFQFNKKITHKCARQAMDRINHHPIYNTYSSLSGAFQHARPSWEENIAGLLPLPPHSLHALAMHFERRDCLTTAAAARLILGTFCWCHDRPLVDLPSHLPFLLIYQACSVLHSSCLAEDQQQAWSHSQSRDGERCHYHHLPLQRCLADSVLGCTDLGPGLVEHLEQKERQHISAAI